MPVPDPSRKPSEAKSSEGMETNRLKIEDTEVNGMDYILLDADGKIAEVTIWWRPLPAGVRMQRHLAGHLGMKPWELLTHTQ